MDVRNFFWDYGDAEAIAIVDRLTGNRCITPVDRRNQSVSFVDRHVQYISRLTVDPFGVYDTVFAPAYIVDNCSNL